MVDGLLKSFDEFRNGCDEKLRYIATIITSVFINQINNLGILQIRIYFLSLTCVN